MKDTRKRKFLKLFILGLLLIPILLVSIIGINYNDRIANQTPKEMVIANTTPTSTQIYWKTKDLVLTKLQYKETTYSGAYTDIQDLYIYYDNLSGRYLYIATISNLKPNTSYNFLIQTPEKRWAYFNNNLLSFSTKDISDNIAFPNITNGNSDRETFVKVSFDDETYIQNTQYHGTWVLNIPRNKEYTIEKYANYTSAQDLGSQLNAFISPVIAESGANCRTGLTINDSSYTPSKETVVDILGRWVQDCPKGGYGGECFNDVYCKSLAAGVNPAFAFTIWTNESSGSNYAASSKVEDFGIHTASGVTGRDFTKQIDWFLNNIAGKGEAYIAGCSQEISKEVQWGSLFFRGNCKDSAEIAKGQQYTTQISEIYSWYTNTPLSWPFTVSKQANACSGGSTKNTTYNTCTKQGTPSNEDSNEEDSNDNGPDKDFMIMSGQDRYCTDTNGCVCLYGYSNSKAEHTVETSKGYTCPAVYTGSATKTEKVCCQSDKGLSSQYPYDCNGTVRSDIAATSCRASTKKIVLKEGVNFITYPETLKSANQDISSAKSLIEYTDHKVIAVGLFRNDTWVNLVQYDNGSIKGNDFNLKGGEAYLIITIEDLTISTSALSTTNSLDTNTLSGWNLVSSTVFGNSSISSVKILENTQYPNIKQIAIWDSKVSSFDYNIEEVSGDMIGDKNTIYNNTGFFIKVVK